MKTSSRSSRYARFFAPALLLTAAAFVAPQARAADSGIAMDGYLSNSQSRSCLALREHDGGTRYLTGNINGLQSGDHVRLYARPIDGSACNVRGNAYEVSEVLTLWGDDRHKTTYYDHLNNGSFESYANANGRSGYRSYGNERNGYDNRGYDNGRSGRSDNRGDHHGRQLVTLRGRLDDNRGSCPVLRDKDGRVWNLVGDLRGFRDRSNAKVIGWTGVDSPCGGPALEVQEITPRR